jgi:hypothetical protein
MGYCHTTWQSLKSDIQAGQGEGEKRKGKRNFFFFALHAHKTRSSTIILGLYKERQ